MSSYDSGLGVSSGSIMNRRTGAYTQIGDFKWNRLKKRDDIIARTSCCCFSFGLPNKNSLPQCIGAGHYCSVLCCETFVQYGFDADFSLELCCSSCRCRRTPFLAPCLKFENTCLSLDCKCGLPCDDDIPLEIGVCGWMFYTKKRDTSSAEPTNPESKCELMITSIKVSDAAPVEFYGKNDLFVEVSFGGIKYRTITQNDVGANATFEIGDRAQGKFRVQDIPGIHLELKLWDENTTRSNTLIGTSEPIDLSKLLETPGDMRTFPFNVQDAKKKVTGSIVVFAKLSLK